ncbi:hypothetical protein [Clostridium taeniosporum]|uniref:Uncharacterized protein n=1 Tax=Clostridium taeniosporum TaxID=394958 RepID=A0A1D7XMY6_9CLOT|nr:hypothetical protein [Clostridium taeniosporum]AOR24637.1 hypothetical protein BGI42_13200 [Clostridium taeniosporum]
MSSQSIKLLKFERLVKSKLNQILVEIRALIGKLRIDSGKLRVKEKIPYGILNIKLLNLYL